MCIPMYVNTIILSSVSYTTIRKLLPFVSFNLLCGYKSAYITGLFFLNGKQSLVGEMTDKGFKSFNDTDFLVILFDPCSHGNLPCGPSSFVQCHTLLWTSFTLSDLCPTLHYSLLLCQGNCSPSARSLMCPTPSGNGQSSSSFSLKSIHCTNLWMQIDTWALGICLFIPTRIQPLDAGQCIGAGLTSLTSFPKNKSSASMSCLTMCQMPC